MNTIIQIFFKLLLKKSIYVICLFLTFSQSLALNSVIKTSNVQTNTNFQQVLRGTVLDENGLPLPGATVREKGTSKGIITDFDGNFNLNVSSGSSVLEISFVGFITREVPVNDLNTLEIVLEKDMNALDEVVVIGYGTTRKENLTGSVGSVDGEDLENIPSSRVDQVLQGRVTGVDVTQANGSPGAASTIRIRGGNSIQGNNDPLFVIDGFIVGTDFDLNNINTNDIESIEVLKDATAISIYGARGANGVILISTKSGRGRVPGEPVFTFNSYYGMQYIMNDVDFLSGPELAEYANEDAEFRNATLPFENPQDVPNVNWLDQITTDAPIANIDLSVTGQSENQKIRYYVSGNYFNQDGIIRESGIDKYIFRNKLDLDITDNIKTGINLNISRLNKENNKVNLSAALRSAGLPVRSIYNEDGSFTAENPVSASIQRNPEADIQLRVSNNQITNLFGNVYLEIEPIENMVIRSNFGPEINYIKRNRYNPGQLPENLFINQGGNGKVDVITSLNLLNENTISYTTSFDDDHQLDLLGGFTWQTYEEESVSAQGFGFPNDALLFNDLANGSDPVRNVIESGWDSYQLVSWLGRANYQFKNKYLLTLVGRVDGSSRFAGSNNEYGFFPSGALAWRLGRESFIEDLNIFDILKLRSSYGLAGSQAISSFRSFAILNGVGSFFGDTEEYAVQNGRPANNNLKWETTKQFDIGLETAFLNGKISFEADYYNKKTEDLLLNVQIPRQTGFSSRLQNLGAIRNQGLEFKLNTVNFSTDDFQWSSTLTISGNRNKVLDLGGVDFIDVVSPTSGGPGGRLIVGETAPVFVGVEYLGTWKSEEEIEASGQTGQSLGGPRFKDTNGDGNVSILDYEVLGSPQPDFIGGISNTISYKNWTLDFFIQGTYGNEIYNSLTQTAYFGRPETNKYAETINRWTPENSNSDIPRAGTVATLSSVFSNSKMIEDGSHLRLKNLRLNYNVPVEKLGLDSLNNLNVYFSGTNLLLISDFRLFDPEVNSFAGDNIASGFASGEYPYARTLSFGITANF